MSSDTENTETIHRHPFDILHVYICVYRYFSFSTFSLVSLFFSPLCFWSLFLLFFSHLFFHLSSSLFVLVRRNVRRSRSSVKEDIARHIVDIREFDNARLIDFASKRPRITYHRDTNIFNEWILFPMM